MYIKSLLKFSTIFLLNLIRNNVAKVLFVFLLIVSFNLAGTFPMRTVEKRIVDSLQVGNRYLYTAEKIVSNEITYELLQFDTRLSIQDNKIRFQESNELNVLFWVLFSVSGAILLVLSIIAWGGEDDASWNFKRSWEEAFSSVITCEFENGKFHYIAFDRLLDVRDNRIDRHATNFGIRGFRDLNMCPKFQTKVFKRENALNRLGIK